MVGVAAAAGAGKNGVLVIKVSDVVAAVEDLLRLSFGTGRAVYGGSAIAGLPHLVSDEVSVLGLHFPNPSSTSPCNRPS